MGKPFENVIAFPSIVAIVWQLLFVKHVQWSLSIANALGTAKNVLTSEVSSFQG